MEKYIKTCLKLRHTRVSLLGNFKVHEILQELRINDLCCLFYSFYLLQRFYTFNEDF